MDRETKLPKCLNLNIFTPEATNYPRLLLTIYDLPPVLYTQGIGSVAHQTALSNYGNTVAVLVRVPIPICLKLGNYITKS